MFWHVYLFNLFILTSSDYNWQQWAELTLDSVLDVSVTIMQKACEDKFSKEVTIARVWFSCMVALLMHREQVAEQHRNYTFPTDFNDTGTDP